MARRSLRPHLNQIRTWVRQGRTDAWIAHQLEVTVQQIDAFKRENDLAPDGDPDAAANGPAPDFDDEIDLRAEDDAAIAAELEAAEAKRREEEEAAAAAADGDDEDSDGEAEEGDEPKPRRGRRGGRSRGGRRRATSGPLEGAFDHGEEGYGLWLDPAVADNPTYAEHWAGHRPVEVTIEEDQIVIRRAGAGDDD
ncbi:MAG: hypothetical protein M3469_05175 [Actinomycetota bacterium]|jgi:DNA-binding protein H-NS|nr:hypothetical protein [Solirubrobacterales bacterium]MBA3861895.1 hypothetical protein [Solirubrobacterales bacterium]MDQ3409356.1 hypothetical protein [Actinomycetota bacterium]